MPDEPDEDLSQLELPSLFRRQKGGKKTEKPEARDPEPAETTEAEAEPEARDPEPAETTEAEAEPEPIRETETVEPTPEAETVEPTPEVEQGAPASASRPEDEGAAPTLATHFSLTPRRKRPTPTPPTAAEQAVEPDPPEVEQRAPASASRPGDEPADDDSAATDGDTTTPARRLPRWFPARAPKAQTEPGPEEPDAPADETAAREAEEAREPSGPSLLDRVAAARLPEVPGQAASVLVGAVTGLVAVALVLLTQAITDAVRGTSNAGAAGLFLVAGIIALAVFLGAAGLRAFGQSDVLSTSFLGTGLVTVLVMLFLLPAVDRWWMVIVIPVLGAAAYALSWWVSNRLGPEARQINDEYSPETHR